MLKNIRGSLLVEAAIFLPLFIIGILTVGYLIKTVQIEENVFHSLADETGKLASEATAPVRLITFNGDLVKRIEEENIGDVKNVEIKPFLYRLPYPGLGIRRSYTNLIGVTAAYEVTPRIPAIFMDSLKADETILCRAFVGRNDSGTVMPFSDMETNGQNVLVWIFPRAGERYHKETCTYIVNEPREVLLTAALRNKYKPCSLCKPGAMKNGSLVYCFQKTGEVFHKGSCYLVERYVISISDKDAEDQGYTPCMKCGGK